MCTFFALSLLHLHVCFSTMGFITPRSGDEGLIRGRVQPTTFNKSHTTRVYHSKFSLNRKKCIFKSRNYVFSVKNGLRASLRE